MEFKLNKIDPDLRRQVNETAQSGKVHGADHNLSVNKDKKGNREKQSFHEALQDKKKILVNAVKEVSINIEAFSEEDEINSTNKGRFLDIRK